MYSKPIKGIIITIFTQKSQMKDKKKGRGAGKREKGNFHM